MVLLYGIGKKGGVLWNKGNRLYYMEHDRQLMLYGCFYGQEGRMLCLWCNNPSFSFPFHY